LAADNADKLCRRWVGPVTIVKVVVHFIVTLWTWVTVKSGTFMPISFANLSLVFMAGVISDGDVDFGRVLQPVNDVCDSEPSEHVSADRLTHLNVEQCNELLSVLDEFTVSFTDRPGLCTGAVVAITCGIDGTRPITNL